MKEYEVLKTTVLGVGPWYVSPKGRSEICGIFRLKKNAILFAKAKTNPSYQAHAPDSQKLWTGD